MSTFQKIFKVVAHIPKGKVTTYKHIAEFLSIQNPRIVGFALHRNTSPQTVPCHRVVYSTGRLTKGYAFGGTEKQKEKLLEEGVMFMDEITVDLTSSLHFFLRQ